MVYVVDDFVGGELWVGVGEVGDFVVLVDEFLVEGVLDFFDGVVEDSWDGKERVLDDGDVYGLDGGNLVGGIF